MFPTPLQPATPGTVHVTPHPLQEPQAPAPAEGAGKMAKAKDFLLNAWNRTTTLHGQPSSEDLLIEEVASAKETLTVLRLAYLTTDDPDARTQQLAQMMRLQSLLPERERTPLPAEPMPAQALSTPATSLPEPRLQVVPCDPAPPAPPTAHSTTRNADHVGRSLATADAVFPVQGTRCVQPRSAASHDAGPMALRGGAIFSDLLQGNSNESALTRLVGTVGAWCSSHVNMATEKLQRNIAARDNIRNTPQPDAYTKLEYHCNTHATRSALGRLKSSSNGTHIRTLLQGGDYHGNPNAGSYGPAHLAVFSGHNDRLKILLEESVGLINVDQISKVFEETALGVAAQCGNHRGAKLLLGYGATPKTDDFQWLAVRNDLGMFQMLYEHLKAPAHATFGPARKVPKIDFQAVLGTAVVQGSVDVARFVLENGTRLNPNDNVLLQYAAQKGFAEMVRLLLRHAPAGYAQRLDPVTQRSPLETALYAGQVQTFAVLMADHADADILANGSANVEQVWPLLSPFDKEKIAPLRSLLRTWMLQREHGTPPAVMAPHASRLAIADVAANDSEAARPTPPASSRPSGKVFRFGDAFSQPIAL